VKVPSKKSEWRSNPPALSLFKKMVEAEAYDCESVREQGVTPEWPSQLVSDSHRPRVRAVKGLLAYGHADK
jgi:hypothetical protein